MASDLWIQEDGIANGHVIVMDMDGIVFGHLTRLSILVMKKFMFFLQVSNK